jgi:hypothetical protein
MSEFLPKEVRDELAAAQRAQRTSKRHLWVHADGERYRAMQIWGTGFSMDQAKCPPLRGFVDLYEGSRHLGHCLIVTNHDDGDVRVFEFKRVTAPTDKAAVDFVRPDFAPVALLTEQSEPGL